MDKQEDLMILLDQFFDCDLAWVGAMLDQRREDGDHKVSLKILVDLKKGRGRASAADVTRRGEDMRVWWEGQWRPAKLNNIESLLRNYIKDIERRKDYKEEIPDSRQWLLNYALEYALLIWAEKKSVAVGWMPWSNKRPREGDLDVLLERLGLTVGVS
jgi:hypothetical protein